MCRLLFWIFMFEGIAFITASLKPRIHGRYTKSIADYHLSIPHKLTARGEFDTFHLPHFHEHWIEQSDTKRKKRSQHDPEIVHYGVTINGDYHHLELWPNRDFLHPSMVVEKRDLNTKPKDRHVRTLKNKKLCYYTGRVRDIPESRVALSTCDGLSGYIALNGRKYFIEPVDEHSPNSEGHHLHVLHDKSSAGRQGVCGTQQSWEEAMKERFREKLLNGEDIFKVKRGASNAHRYLEMMIVCDKLFLTYHKSRDVELYVMTIMNMVADYYHDSSVGHQMDIVVVRIVYLEKEEKEIDLQINRDSAKTLKSFCEWAVKLNTPEDSPNHFDMAVLLTRYDLCAEGEEDCDLTGLAYVGGACTKDKQCGINEDAGMVLSVIVTHEIGHLLGAEHDEQATACPVQDTDESYFVMSPIVSTYTMRWSTCSRTMISTLLDNSLGDCLNDPPESILYPFSENMPGVVYDANQQCEFMLPASLGMCSGVKEKICENLICKINKKECVGKGEISADGTKCAENKWCFKRKCVEMGARPEAVNGGWGEWGSWSKCSRSCGGGISTSERECNNPEPANKGRYCLGEKQKLKLCNTEPCPDDTPTFRQQQCTEQNSKPWNGEYHQWTASFQDKQPCALYCVNEQNVLSQLEAVVKDGTPCKYGTKDMCIGGVCRAVGCDNVLDSEAMEDHCGVCNGDGTQCKIIEETYKDVGQGYTKVVVIPAGSRKIMIEEKGPTSNIIAIADHTEKKFYLNGDDTEMMDGQYNIGKDVGVYTHTEPQKEKLIIAGPLKEDLVFFIDFFQQENPGFVYRWAEPSVDSTYEPHYHWEIGEFEQCSVLCGGGVQKAIFDCMEEKAGKVSANFCAGEEKPKEEVKNCNEQACAVKWKVGTWGPCRACRNKGGVRVRVVECVKENPKEGADDVLMEDSSCEGVKPGAVELCKATDECGRKRMVSYVPGMFQDHIWREMNRMYRPKRKDAEGRAEDKNLKALKSKLGQVVRDIRPLEDQVLEVYTIRQNPAQKNLSDTANAQMGDEIDDVVDMEHKIIVKGKEAVKMRHEMEHPSKASLKITCHQKVIKRPKSGSHGG